MHNNDKASERPPRNVINSLPGISEIVKRIGGLSPFQSLAAQSTHLPRGDDVSMVKAMNVLLSEAESLRKTVDEQTDRIAHLEALATTDELTGTLNRRGFEEELDRLLARAERKNEEGVLVYVDLDGFKPVNDTFGHAAGDEVLRQVARVLTENVRDMMWLAGWAATNSPSFWSAVNGIRVWKEPRCSMICSTSLGSIGVERSLPSAPVSACNPIKRAIRLKT